MDDEGELTGCTCGSPEEHAAMLIRIDDSFKQDDNRRHTAPTAQSLIDRANAFKNGNSTTTPQTSNLLS